MDSISACIGDLTWWKSAAIGFLVIVAVRRIMRKSTAMNRFSGKGKTVLITGANSGIGKAAAAEFAKRDARVILACRDVNRAKDAVFDIRRKTNKGWLIVKELDLASLESVRTFASDILETESKLDVLVNNAGVMGVPYALTRDGFETTFAVNYLGHFLLTNLLMEPLRVNKSRVVVVSSLLYKNGKIDFEDLNGSLDYSPARAYSQSKLANLLFADTLSAKLSGSGASVCSVSPGMVWTGLARHYIQESWTKQVLYHTIGRAFLQSPKQGCETIIYCALKPNAENSCAKFFRNCKETALLPHARDEATAKRLWEFSQQLTSL